MEFLEKHFRREFKFQANVNLDITFQRFDKDWDEYIEVGIGCKLEHKAKLKAVVTPLLTSTEVSEVKQVFS